MGLLDELKIRNKSLDNEIWVNLGDLSNHLLNFTRQFVQENVSDTSKHPSHISEVIFFRGVTEGMMSVVALLAQGGVEAEFHEKIHTVEDLLKSLDKNEG